MGGEVYGAKQTGTKKVLKQHSKATTEEGWRREDVNYRSWQERRAEMAQEQREKERGTAVTKPSGRGQ